MTRLGWQAKKSLSVVAFFTAFCISGILPANAACSNPAGEVGEIVYNNSEDFFQGCMADDTWQALHGNTGPTNCDNIGETCDDGSYFVGNIGAGPIYATNESFESQETWNDGNSNYSTTGATSDTDGAANTATLVTADSDDVTAGVQPHNAAIYCDGLSAHGYGDWYLPARDELGLFWNGGAPVANVDESGSNPDGYYWSSSESAYLTGSAWGSNFSTGTPSTASKRNGHPVRCVRQASAACTNPPGSTGEIIYNSSEYILQGCTSGGWQALHAASGGSTDPCNPENSPSPGQICGDGSYFIGNVGAGPVYATNENFESQETWNDGNSNYSTTGATSTTDGEGNTAILVAADSDDVVAGTQPHDAAIYCDSLSAHGYDDWYLPAPDELALFWNGGSPIASIDESGSGAGVYWTSSESSDSFARYRVFDADTTGSSVKSYGRTTRCVRNGYLKPNTCQNPSGHLGEIIYNTSENVFQACTANGWQALHQ